MSALEQYFNATKQLAELEKKAWHLIRELEPSLVRIAQNKGIRTQNISFYKLEDKGNGFFGAYYEYVSYGGPKEGGIIIFLKEELVGE